jgi:CYTH domain-containing protein
MTSRVPGEGRYAKLEHERRWVLDALPAGVTDQRYITDAYLIGTRLRLRKVQSEGETVFKLCQKVRIDEASPERVKITNIYLSPDEYKFMLTLPSSSIVKTRYTYMHTDVIYAIDQFHGRHAGLVLAESEMSESHPTYPVPEFARLDVTRDERYSGGSLALASDDVLRHLIG